MRGTTKLKLMNFSKKESRRIALLTVVSNIQTKGEIQVFCDVMLCSVLSCRIRQEHDSIFNAEE